VLNGFMFVEIVAAYFVLRYLLHWLAGAALGILFISVCAIQGVWWPLIGFVILTLIIGSLIKLACRLCGWTPRPAEKSVEELCAEARRIHEQAQGFTFSDNSYGNSVSRGGLHADYGDRLDRTRRWASR
jgi:hypothetical protein